jgi:hypothetical protein
VSLRLLVELNSRSETQFARLPYGVLTRTSTHELPLTGDHKLIDKPPSLATQYNFIFHIVVFFAILRTAPDLESSTIITCKAEFNCTCDTDVR